MGKESTVLPTEMECRVPNDALNRVQQEYFVMQDVFISARTCSGAPKHPLSAVISLANSQTIKLLFL